ncbi:MAG TPA: hypothetical protein VMZ51_07520 [Acidimicrobiales bacterium]|nr:hypothetical protein [Acidimicrobiales bacterium]
MEVLLAALKWDPQIRGASIVLAGIFVLMGSVYLLLSTNMGARVGFLLTVAGISGWFTVMGAVWMVFGIGLKGSEPEWRVLEVIDGEMAQSTQDVVAGFPDNWKSLKSGDAGLADAQAAADHVLAPAAAETGGHGEEAGGGEPEEKFESPFKKTDDYVLLDGYRKGGEKYLLTLRHRPHYAIVRVKPSFFDKAVPGLKPQLDLTAPTTSVLMVRDLGNLRFPPFLFTIASAIFFGVTCYSLHQRDREVMRQRAEAALA